MTSSLFDTTVSFFSLCFRPCDPYSKSKEEAFASFINYFGHKAGDGKTASTAGQDIEIVSTPTSPSASSGDAPGMEADIETLSGPNQ